jgi:hypothetical protein
MKRLLSIIFFLVLCGYCYAEEPASDKTEKTPKNIFGFDIGILATDISYGTDKTFALKFNANLANFYFENIKTGLGVEFFPINYSYSVSANEHILSFSKLYLIWNMDKIMKLSKEYINGIKVEEKLTFGPFLSIQTLNLVNFENFNTNISYSAGIKLARKNLGINLGEKEFPITFAATNIELGYNYFNNKQSIYFTIGLTPVFVLSFPIISVLLPFFGIDGLFASVGD